MQQGQIAPRRYLTNMVRTIKQLRETPDDVLISEHDKEAVNTFVGTGYYIDELERRDRRRAIEASDRLARGAFWLAIANTLLAFIAAVTAVIALFK